MDCETDSISQAATIAVSDGRVCLITARSSGRWVIPKGGIDPGRTPAEMATIEAWEEAGLVGELSDDPVGEFSYRKNGRTHRVTVYLLVVTHVARDWPERSARRRRWFEPDVAAELVSESGLRSLFLELTQGAGI